MLKNKFTLAIILHERKHHIESLLKYYKNFPCEIILADSSKEKYNGYLPSNTTLMHYPEELYYSKLYKILDTIKTPYVLELSDDDIVYQEAIIECIEFLDSAPNYVCVDGKTNRSSGKISDKFYNQFESNDPLDRIYTCLNTNWPTMRSLNHTVVKTNIIKEIYKFVLDRPKLYPVRFFDKIWAFIACYRGNYKVLDINFGKRSGSERLFDFLPKYPLLLEKETYFNKILEPGRLDQLVDFLVKEGYEKSFAEKFTYNAIKNIT